MEKNRWQELNSSTTRIGQEPAQPSPKQSPEKAKAGGLSTGAKAGFGVGAVAILGLSGFIAFGGGGSEDDQSTTAVAQTETADADEQPDASLTFSDDESSSDDGVADDTPVSDDNTDTNADAVPDTTDQDAATDTSEAVPAVIGADSPPPPPGAPEAHSILANGKIYLRGTVPSEDVQGLIVTAVEAVMGPGNVVTEYTIDPTVPFDPTEARPVYVADAVLFSTNSAEIDPQFFPLLGLGVSLMQLQPGVTIEAVGHTDSEGSSQANLELSQARVDAWLAWMVSQGIDPERLTATGKGESEPRADNNTAEGRQLNRRVEFIITGFEF